MNNFLFRIAAALSLAAVPAFAPAQPGLPPDGAVETALNDHPKVMAAKARIGVAEADANALRKGSHEFTVSGSYMRRSVVREGDYDEFDLSVMRPFRLHGKARLDRKAGEFGITAAQNVAEDAKHQAAILLADIWWDWLGAAAEARIDDQSAQNLARALSGVKRRVALRDASVLEANQAEAALGAARLAAQQSKGRMETAKARLISQFPSLPLLAVAEELPLPEIPSDGFAAMRDQVIKRSHEIAAADAVASRLGAIAERTQKDRMADPSFGVRIFSERNGAERGAGLIASMPLGGGHRRALADKALQEHSAAMAEAAAVRFDVNEMANTDLAQAEAAWQAWQRSREGLNAQVAAVLKMRRGYDLRAIDLADLLFAERQTQEAFRVEAKTRAEALRSITRLRIDSHNLWIGEEEGHD